MCFPFLKMKGIKPGDYVEISLMKKEYRGILLESPEEKGIVLLKLNSGYNIGFNKKDILDIEVLEKSVEVKNEIKIGNDKNKPNIAMIITGGTIASKLDPKTGGVDSLETPEEFFKFYPELFGRVNVVKIEVPFMKASEDMDFKDWQEIARVSVELLNNSNVEGLIITHGTDFLHYTSAALSFFLRDLNKPVVLTYCQKSIDRASSDARLNLQCSSLAAVSDIAEVMLVGHGSSNDDFCYAMPGAKTRKLHTSKRDAFKVVNGKPFAKISEEEIRIISPHKKKKKGKVKLDLKFEEKIALVKIYPGQNPDILDYYKKEKYRGIVIEMSGLGHVPVRGKNSWIKKLKEVQKEIIICGVSQCINGRVNPLVYSNGRELLNTGIIYLEDMLAETALVKLGWVLGHKEWKSKDKVKEKMLENIASDFSK